MALLDGAGLPANEVHIRATWQCKACPASAMSSYTVSVEDLRIDVPQGWTIAGGEAYCGRHTVEVKVTTNNLREMPARSS